MRDDMRQKTAANCLAAMGQDGRAGAELPPLLTLRDLHAGYGNSRVLQGVSLSIRAGEIVALLGRNGAGRSTLAKAILGLVPSRGECVFRGQTITGLPTHAIAKLGVGYVPEQRDVFPRLSVRQNLQLGIKPPSPHSAQPTRWRMEDIWQMFPSLLARADAPAGVLSGGEQQMLTLSRTLLGNPDLVLVDEPTEGLAPQVVAQVADCLRTLRERGVAVLLMEQKLTIALAVSDRALVMGHGRIVFDGLPSALQADAQLQKAWLAV